MLLLLLIKIVYVNIGHNKAFCWLSILFFSEDFSRKKITIEPAYIIAKLSSTFCSVNQTQPRTDDIYVAISVSHGALKESNNH